MGWKTRLLGERGEKNGGGRLKSEDKSGGREKGKQEGDWENKK